MSSCRVNQLLLLRPVLWPNDAILVEKWNKLMLPKQTFPIYIILILISSISVSSSSFSSSWNANVPYPLCESSGANWTCAISTPDSKSVGLIKWRWFDLSPMRSMYVEAVFPPKDLLRTERFQCKLSFAMY